jgi:hypothetical protein
MISSQELSEYMIDEYFFYFFDTEDICASFPACIDTRESTLIEYSCVVRDHTRSCEIIMFSSTECFFWILYLIWLQEYHSTPEDSTEVLWKTRWYRELYIEITISDHAELLQLVEYTHELDRGLTWWEIERHVRMDEWKPSARHDIAQCCELLRGWLRIEVDLASDSRCVLEVELCHRIHQCSISLHGTISDLYILFYILCYSEDIWDFSSEFTWYVWSLVSIEQKWNHSISPNKS